MWKSVLCCGFGLCALLPVCIRVCTWICTCACLHACLYACVCIRVLCICCIFEHTNIYTGEYKHVHTHMYIQENLTIHNHILEHVYICIQTCTHAARAHTRTQGHTQTLGHTHTHTHKHTHMCTHIHPSKTARAPVMNSILKHIHNHKSRLERQHMRLAMLPPDALRGQRQLKQHAMIPCTVYLDQSTRARLAYRNAIRPQTPGDLGVQVAAHAWTKGKHQSWIFWRDFPATEGLRVHVCMWGDYFFVCSCCIISTVMVSFDCADTNI